ncbi:MAG: hypothetical protein A2Z64_11300 [Betaproteobacteria bacterium RIFCSPLOWO2_02_67_12]|nr:MAG: hypothetical protein A2Z64_11300 [Betaproteobacteria bacterium RIFCSPLOWO2_02_67_12]OGA28829.1 MAG: hypothetical protein A3I65_11140 [Betaproteobacteria bacterium RIFCSPLOWO2_02_FULL_68_150]OGA63130.1 MAG: hypothetical protein A3F77_05280 [Betaproteobacteria bacterium RIFCSPLOWO2_12_FULL_67_28]
MALVQRTARPSDNLAGYFAGGEASRLALSDGSRVGVIGGGPAGTFFTHFLLRLAAAVDLDVAVDIYEPRNFAYQGPAGCNHCGGIVSESLVQLLATEGINLPPSIVRRGIESYVLHMDIGNVRIETPLHEKRIAAVFRGNGPRVSEPIGASGSFDGYLLELAASSGAKVVRKLVNEISWDGGRPQVTSSDGATATYDLLAVAAGVNSQALQLFGEVAPQYHSPKTLKTFICEFKLSPEALDRHIGPSMHVFLLDIPRLEFAALIPKGEFLTLCLLGHDVDNALIDTFLSAPEVKACFPDGAVPSPVCHCFPRVNVVAAARPYGDRIVWIGDSGVARLYKDGIGSAYRVAKAAAKTVVHHGVADEDFRRHFWPACKRIDNDNSIAKVIFAVSGLIQKLRFLRRGVLRMTANEQRRQARRRHMSTVLWDLFTGSAPYREVLSRSFHPEFPAMLCWNLIAGNAVRARRNGSEEPSHE